MFFLDAVLPKCSSEAIIEYVQLCQPRTEELPLLPLRQIKDNLTAGVSDVTGTITTNIRTTLLQRQHDHLDNIMVHLVGNPLHVYSVIHRIIRKLPPVIAALEDCQMTEEVELVRKNILQAGEVTEADLVGAMQSLIRIQFTYRSISQYHCIVYLFLCKSV